MSIVAAAQAFQEAGFSLDELPSKRIALVGGTSRAEGAEHLHFELWQGGQSLDPTRFISF